ncbi:MAG TPA: hypothetical protein VGL86_25260 [Polyangia bacterium]
MIVAAMLPACGLMGGLARTQFMQDHNGCEPTLVRERPDLLAPGQPPPNVVAAGHRAYEVVGCNSHDLEVCYSAGYTPDGVLSPAECSSEKMCDPSPSCSSDYPTAASVLFVTEYSCPRDRVTAASSAPIAPAVRTAPADVAADPARMAVWTQTHQEEINRIDARNRSLHFVTVDGCGSHVVYACQRARPSAPRCSLARADSSGAAAPSTLALDDTT